MDMRVSKILCYILVPIAFLLGAFSMTSSSDSIYLPVLDFNNPYVLKESSKVDLLTKINAIREKNGLLPVSGSIVLDKSSIYRSLYISQYPDNIDSLSFISGPLKNKTILEVFPYVKKEEVIFLDDGKYNDDALIATYFAKAFENIYTTGRILLDPSIKSLGISIIYFESKTVCVLHSSNLSELANGVNVVPDVIVKPDTTPPNISTTDLFIAKDLVLDSKKVNQAIKYVDNSGLDCTVSFNLNQVKTSQIGVYSLDVTVTDKSGNKASKILKVNVVTHVYPVITDSEIILPNVSFEDIYDLTKYINVEDNYGVEFINAEPKFALKEDVGKSVLITVMNKAGLMTQKTLSIRFSDIPFYESPIANVLSIYPQKDEPLTTDMIKSAILCDDGAIIEVDQNSFNKINRNVPGIYYCLANVKVLVESTYVQTPIAVPVHIVLDSAAIPKSGTKSTNTFKLKYYKNNRSGLIEENAHIVLDANKKYDYEVNYTFTIKEYQGDFYSIKRKTSSVIWNPEVSGLYEINVTVTDLNNLVLGASSMNLYVSEKALNELVVPYLDFKPSSELVIDSYNKTISNITEKLTVNSFLSNFIICDEGIEGLKLRVKEYQGNILGSDKFVGTGSLLELYKDEIVYESYGIILYGDVTGDGKIDISDYVAIRRQLFEPELGGLFYKSGNIANRLVNQIDISDYVALRSHLFGIEIIRQK